MDDSQLTGSCSSYARKYSLNGLLLIDDTNDTDTPDNSNSKTLALDGTPKDTPPKEVKMVTGQQKANIYNYFNVLGIDNIANLSDDKDYIPVVEFLKGKGISSVEDLDFATADRLEKFLHGKHERSLKNES